MWKKVKITAPYPALQVLKHWRDYLLSFSISPVQCANVQKPNSWMYIRVQWFWLFFTFWGITTHPWHPKGPRIWKLAKKIFQLHPWPAEIFGKNRKMRFFGTISKFNFRSPVQQIFTIFLAWFIYGILNTHKKFYVSKSKTVVTREWPRQCSKYICLQSLESKF